MNVPDVVIGIYIMIHQKKDGNVVATNIFLDRVIVTLKNLNLEMYIIKNFLKQIEEVNIQLILQGSKIKCIPP